MYQAAFRMEYFLVSVEDVARELTTSPAGLDTDVARQRLAEYGPNQLAETKRNTAWQLLLHQLTDTMILVLLWRRVCRWQ